MTSVRKVMYWNKCPNSLATLVRMWPDYSASKIAEVIGCSVNSVKKKGVQLGLEKSETFQQKYPQYGNLGKATFIQPKRITHPRPGVTIHRML